jgi:hypothetical protein
MRSLHELRHRSSSEFVAYASSTEHNRNMIWNTVLGSLNGKVEHMRIQPGIGIGGIVLRHGTACIVDERRNASILRECPVILAEKLRSAIGLPVPADGIPYSIRGILLLGRRNDLPFTEEEVQLLLFRGKESTNDKSHNRG